MSEMDEVSKKSRRALRRIYNRSWKKRGSLKKFILSSIAAIIFLLILTVIPYLLVFHGGLSPDHLAWSSFGSYIGGIFGPAFSLLSFIAVVVTLSIERRRIAEGTKIAELRHTLDTIDVRLRDFRQTIAFIMATDASKDVIQKYPDWRELSACLNFMSYCIDQLDRSAEAPVISAYYSSIYGKVVKRLLDKGAFDAAVYLPFQVHLPETG